MAVFFRQRPAVSRPAGQHVFNGRAARPLIRRQPEYRGQRQRRRLFLLALDLGTIRPLPVQQKRHLALGQATVRVDAKPPGQGGIHVPPWRGRRAAVVARRGRGDDGRLKPLLDARFLHGTAQPRQARHRILARQQPGTDQ